MPEQGKQKRLIAFPMAYFILNNDPYFNQNVRMRLNMGPLANRILADWFVLMVLKSLNTYLMGPLNYT